jgi:hypothetical protein
LLLVGFLVLEAWYPANETGKPDVLLADRSSQGGTMQTRDVNLVDLADSAGAAEPDLDLGPLVTRRQFPTTLGGER